MAAIWGSVGAPAAHRQGLQSARISIRPVFMGTYLQLLSGDGGVPSSVFLLLDVTSTRGVPMPRRKLGGSGRTEPRQWVGCPAGGLRDAFLAQDLEVALALHGGQVDVGNDPDWNVVERQVAA